MNISLSDHFTYKKLLRFTFPSVIMMILTSIYGVVDGVFVSNFVGSEAFASINIIMPFLMILGAIGFMTGTGGSALVALTFGTGNEKKAKEIFSLLVYVLIAVGFLFTVGGEVLLAPMAKQFVDSKDFLAAGIQEYENSLRIVNSPDEYTGRQVKDAQAFLDKYDTKDDLPF